LFGDYIDALNLGNDLPVPTGILNEENTSVELDASAEVVPRQFASKMDAARYLKDALAPISALVLDRNQGIWGWLSLFYFNQLCPESTSGHRTPGQAYRYLLSSDWKHRYRHLLAGPFTLYVHHGEAARTILERPVTKHGDFAEQLASRYEIVRNHELLKSVDKLYWDETARGPKRGATNRRRRGSLRRLTSIISQFEVTFDLFSMNSNQILALLPSEFDSWKGSA
jgi:hypothetical protein